MKTVLRITVALVAALLMGALVSPLTASAAPDSTVWLCRPGAPNDPCGGGTQAPVDCFYVYPTASLQQSVTADFGVGPELVTAATAQARPFDGTCNVWAPVYRQSTLRTLFLGTPQERQTAAAVAYSDVERAWSDYLAYHNNGRGVVLIGHSQGTRMLSTLLRERIGRAPAEQARVISALLIGLPLRPADVPSMSPCTDAAQTGCYVAYSTFNRTPPPNSRFGGPGVVCTNPASLGRNDRAPVRGPIPGSQQFTGQCTADNVLLVQGGIAPALPALPTADWGLHLLDINIAQDDLVNIVAAQSRTFAPQHR